MLSLLAMSACGMMEKQTAALSDQDDWFRTAYYSSAANFEDDTADTTAVRKPIRMRLP